MSASRRWIIGRVPGCDIVVPVAAGSRVVWGGRTPDNDVVLNYPMVSGKHARVTVAGGRAEIEDLGSSNGIAIGDPNNRVRRAPFSASDVLFFGSLRIPGSRLLG